MAHIRVILAGLIALIVLLLIGFPLVVKEHYLLLSVFIMVVALLPFGYYFAKRQINTRELVVLAMLGAIAAVSRVPFAALPSVQPSSFIIMMTGIVFGPQAGFVVGVLTAIISNMFLGQGPWTPWQMFAWGMIGLCAGLLAKTGLIRSLFGKSVYGFMAGILFGWAMNIWFVMLIVKSFTWELIYPFYVASLPFDMAHAITNVILIVLFSSVFINVLERFKVKYGLFEV